MLRSAVLTICLILILGSPTWAQSQVSTSVLPNPQQKKSEKFKAEWRFLMRGTDTSDEQTQSKYVDFRLELKSKYLLTSNLYVDFQPVVRMVSGQTQSIDGADKMENKVLLNQAALHYNPASFLRLTAGALSQRYLHSRILMDELAFPAARAATLYRGDHTETALTVETAIPTSTSLSTNTKEMEPTPSLNTAALSFKWEMTRDTFWRTSVGYFMYNNLPSAVAQQSKILGNDVDNPSEASYIFKYKYQGIEALSYFQIPVLSRLDLIGGAEYLRNDQAPSDLNTGYRIYGGGNVSLTRNLELMLTAGYFSIAPEAAVAYFNAKNYETNRIGYNVESWLAFLKEGFRIGIRYTESDLMYEMPTQFRQKTLMLNLETFYVDI